MEACAARGLCSQTHSWSFPCFAVCHSKRSPAGFFPRLLCQLGYSWLSMGGTVMRLESRRKGEPRVFLALSAMGNIFSSRCLFCDSISHQTCLLWSQLPLVTLNSALRDDHLLLLSLQLRHGSAFLWLLISMLLLHPLCGLSVLPSLT